MNATPAKSDGGTALLSAFANLGADYIFCCSGSEWAAVWEALARRDADKAPGPVYLDVWHETVAVGMATGYGLIKGHPQPVMLHAGAGLLQGSMAIHGALLAGVPLVAMSAEAITYGENAEIDPGSQWYRNLSNIGGPRDFARPVVKWSNQVLSIETLYESIQRAGEIAARTPAGPVFVSVPVEVLQHEWAPPKYSRRMPLPGRKLSSQEEVTALAKDLMAAKAPLVISESTGRDPQAFAELVKLCELLAIPVVEPQSSICGNFPRSHPMHLGGAVEPFMESVDLVLLVNCRAPWYPPSNKPANARVVTIDESPQRLQSVYQVSHADVLLEGEVADVLAGAAREVRKLGVDAAKIEARRVKLAERKAKQTQAITAAEAKAAGESGKIDPVNVAMALRELAGDDVIYADETITHSRVLQTHLGLEKQGSYYYVQGGLGQGIAVAMGIKLAAPERLVVLPVGDGSFLYNPVIPSFAAMKNHKVPILIVVFNNKKYLSMQMNLKRAYPEGFALETNSPYGNDLSSQPDLAEFAKPFGMFAETVSSPAALRQTLEKAIAAVRGGRGAIVNVMVAR